MQNGKEITVKVKFSTENVQAVIGTYKDIVGKAPSEKWVREFLVSYVEDESMDVDGTFIDNLFEIISESI